MRLLWLSEAETSRKFQRHRLFADHLTRRGHTVDYLPQNEIGPNGFRVMAHGGINHKWFEANVNSYDALWSPNIKDADFLSKALGAGPPLIIDTDDPMPEHGSMNEQALREADAVTTSTDYLFECIEKINPRVYLLPLAIDSSLWDHPRGTHPSHEVRMLWSAHRGRYNDIDTLREPLENTWLRFQYGTIDLRYITVQYLSDWMQPWVEDGRAIVLPMPKQGEYQKMLRRYAPDIGLSPLSENSSGPWRSPTKYFDYAMAGAAGIYTKSPVYSCIDNGHNGMLAESSEEWEECLARLILDKQLRDKIASNAREDVLALYDINKTIPAIEATLQEAIKCRTTSVSRLHPSLAQHPAVSLT